jgi:hypothetical protein
MFSRGHKKPKKNNKSFDLSLSLSLFLSLSSFRSFKELNLSAALTKIFVTVHSTATIINSKYTRF